MPVLLLTLPEEEVFLPEVRVLTLLLSLPEVPDGLVFTALPLELLREVVVPTRLELVLPEVPVVYLPLSFLVDVRPEVE